MGDSYGGACETARVSTWTYAGDTSVSIAQTPDGFVVFSVEKAGSNMVAQRFAPDWSPLTAEPLQLAVSRTLVAAAYSDRLLLASNTGTGTEIASVTFGDSPPSIMATVIDSSILEPTATGGLFRRDPVMTLVTAAGGGFSAYTIAKDGMALGSFGGAGVGEPSAVCSLRSDGMIAGGLCVKPVEPCVRMRLTATGGTGVGGSTETCTAPSVVQLAGHAYAVFEQAGTLRMMSWQSDTTTGTFLAAQVAASGSHPYITADARGLSIAYVAGGELVTAGVDTSLVVTRQPASIPGVPSALGIDGVPAGDHTVILIATASGMYRACM